MINPTEIVRIVIRAATGGGPEELDSVQAIDSSNDIVATVSYNNIHEYGFSADDEKIQAMLTAYMRETSPAVLTFSFYTFPAMFTVFAETEAAYEAANIANPGQTAIRKPHQWMVDGNFFLRTDDPTNAEFSDQVGGDSGGGTAGGNFPEVTTLPASWPTNQVIYLTHGYNSNSVADVTMALDSNGHPGYSRDMTGLAGTPGNPRGSFSPDPEALVPNLLSVLRAGNGTAVVQIHSRTGAAQAAPELVELRDSLSKVHLDGVGHDLVPATTVNTLGTVKWTFASTQENTEEPDIPQYTDGQVVRLRLELDDGSFFIFAHENDWIPAGLYQYRNGAWVAITKEAEPTEQANTYTIPSTTVDLRRDETSGSDAAGSVLPATTIPIVDPTTAGISANDLQRDGNELVAQRAIRVVISLPLAGQAGSVGHYVDNGVDASGAFHRANMFVELVRERDGADLNVVSRYRDVPAAQGQSIAAIIDPVAFNLDPQDRVRVQARGLSDSIETDIKSTEATIQGSMRVAVSGVHTNLADFASGLAQVSCQDVALPRFGHSAIEFSSTNLIDTAEYPWFTFFLNVHTASNEVRIPLGPFNITDLGLILIAQTDVVTTIPANANLYLLVPTKAHGGYADVYVGNPWNAWPNTTVYEFGMRMHAFRNADGLLSGFRVYPRGQMIDSPGVGITLDGVCRRAS